MTREQEIKQAGIAWTIANKPVCIAGDNFADVRDEFNHNLDFEAGAKWADAHPVHYDGKAMLYVNNKSHENGYKEAVEKACEWMDCYIDNYLFIDAENKAGIKWDDFINDFRKVMKGE